MEIKLTSHQKKRQYQIKRGLIQKKPEFLSRTVDGIKYLYPERMDPIFNGWAASQRKLNRPYYFDSYYQQLPPDHKALITVTRLNK
jgi:hypothetical protein